MFKPSSLTTTCLMLLSLTWLIFAAATVAAQTSSMDAIDLGAISP
jgi:hypothetical protein